MQDELARQQRRFGDEMLERDGVEVPAILGLLYLRADLCVRGGGGGGNTGFRSRTWRRLWATCRLLRIGGVEGWKRPRDWIAAGRGELARVQEMGNGAGWRRKRMRCCLFYFVLFLDKCEQPWCLVANGVLDEKKKNSSYAWDLEIFRARRRPFGAKWKLVAGCSQLAG